jgi:hypothetical protein
MVNKKTPVGKSRPREGFDVVCTIGRVEFGNGNMPPHVAAFALIAEADMPGTYSFPTANGGVCEVTVVFHDEPERPTPNKPWPVEENV